MAIYVVIPVHNRLPFTRACLASLRAQDVPDVHAVVVDDGSTDGTYAALSAEEPDVTLLWGDGDLWWSGAMNRGLAWVMRRAAPGDHVLTLNNDTVLLPGFLPTLAELAATHPGTLIGSTAVLWDDRDRIVDGGARIDWRTGRSWRLADGLTLTEAAARYGELPRVSVLSGRGTLVPVEAYRRAGLYDRERLPQYGADWEFSRRAERRGFDLLVTFRARLACRPEATGVRPSAGRLTWRQFVRAHMDVRSPSGLQYRWNFARLSAEPWALPLFAATDVARTVGGGVRRQVRCRLGGR